MKKIYNLLLVTGLCFAALSNASEIDKEISQIIAFGDSYTDNGASVEVSKRILASPNKPKDAYLLPADPASNLYWKGRWTNGKTAVEVLAEGLKLPLTNYAVGGAKSGKDNYYAWINQAENTGFLGQIERFKATLGDKTADPKALYYIFVSANDYFQHLDYELPGSIAELSEQTLSNIRSGINELATLGAKQFIVVNSSDLSIVPWEVANNRTQPAKQFTQAVNQGLATHLPADETKLSISVLLIDHVAISKKIRTNPEKYGLTELDKPFELTYPKVKISEGNPDEYYFWDEWHPTKVVHRAVGEEILKLIEH